MFRRSNRLVAFGAPSRRASADRRYNIIHICPRQFIAAATLALSPLRSGSGLPKGYLPSTAADSGSTFSLRPSLTYFLLNSPFFSF